MQRSKEEVLSVSADHPARLILFSIYFLIKKFLQGEPSYVFVKLETLSKLLHSLSSYCQFSEATTVFTELSKFTWDKAITIETYPNLASIYNEFSSHHFVKSNYHESYTWAMEVGILQTCKKIDFHPGTDFLANKMS